MLLELLGCFLAMQYDWILSDWQTSDFRFYSFTDIIILHYIGKNRFSERGDEPICRLSKWRRDILTILQVHWKKKSYGIVTDFFFGKFTKYENRHKMGCRWWFLRSDRWFFDTLTAPDTFQTSNVWKHITFDKKLRGNFNEIFKKMKMFTKWVVVYRKST